jgi:beta-galactosidase
VFAEGALAGWPAVTRRAHGEGGAWYVATLPEDDALRRLAGALLADAGVRALGPVATGGAVEAVERGELLFLINHGGTGATLDVDGTDILTGESARGLVLEPQGVAIVEGT